MKEANNLLADAVFEGGGVKGIGLVGAVAVAEEKGYQWENVAGTSAGAIVAALMAAGYSAAEMKEIIEELDYNRLKDTSILDKVPLVGPVASLIFEKGIYEGRFFEKWMRGLLRKKNVHCSHCNGGASVEFPCALCGTRGELTCGECGGKGVV